MSKYQKRIVAPNEDNDYYYSNKNAFYSSGYGMNISSKNTNGGNCTCYAHGRFAEITNKFPNIYGNAEDWFASAKKNGYSVGNTPKLGAIICWQSGASNNSSDGCGHVAIVEEIYSDNSILISESGWNSYIFKTEKILSPYNRSNYKLLGFIYCGIEFSNSATVNYEGYLDNCSSTKIEGWLWDKTDNSTTATIKIFSGTILKKTINSIANVYREDLKVANKGNGKHGFNSSIRGLDDGDYIIKVYDPKGNQIPSSDGKVKTITIKTVLNSKSYSNYPTNKYYRVRKSFKDSISSKGSFNNWSNAFNVWNKFKSQGWHIYNNEGKQLD